MRKISPKIRVPHPRRTVSSCGRLGFPADAVVRWGGAWGIERSETAVALHCCTRLVVQLQRPEGDVRDGHHPHPSPKNTSPDRTKPPTPKARHLDRSGGQLHRPPRSGETPVFRLCVLPSRFCRHPRAQRRILIPCAPPRPLAPFNPRSECAIFATASSSRKCIERSKRIRRS